MFDNERYMGSAYVIVRVCNRTQIIVGGVMNLSEQIEQMLQEPIREFREIVIPQVREWVHPEVESVQRFEYYGGDGLDFCLYDKDGIQLRKISGWSDPTHDVMIKIYDKAEKIIDQKYGGFVGTEVINRGVYAPEKKE